MQKFAAVRTKDNEEEILFVSESKEKAMQMCEEYAKNASRSTGLISLESAEFDENNNKVDGRCRLYKTWR